MQKRNAFMQQIRIDKLQRDLSEMTEKRDNWRARFWVMIILYFAAKLIM